MSYVTHLECTFCGARHDAGSLQTVCAAEGRPLRVCYDLPAVGRNVGDRLAWLAHRPWTMWRYAELLPLDDPQSAASLGETVTPLLECPALAAALGLQDLRVKDESRLPTGSFKARGMAMAVSRARELGARRLAVPSAGNAGAALAAYAARAGLEAWVAMPRDAPGIHRAEVEAAGARLTLVDGSIADAGRLIKQSAATEGWFNLATLAEPYRVEGKKTMGLELLEQLDWEPPAVIVYPTGGGTGLVGMDKAFTEMQALGWMPFRRPRFLCAQAAGCAPIVRALEAGEVAAQPWTQPQTIAAGLRVPSPLGDVWMLDAIRRSSGSGETASDTAAIQGAELAFAREGLFLCPEAGAAVAALEQAVRKGWVTADERVVLFNTGSGLKYPDAFARP